MLELKTVQLVCMIGNDTGAERFSVSTSRSFSNDVLSFDISSSEGHFTASLDSKAPIRIVKLAAVFGCSFRETDRIFLNGYQSATESREYTIHERMKGLELIPPAVIDNYCLAQCGDYGFTEYSKEEGKLHGFSYGYIRSGETFSFFGSLAEDSGFTVIRTDTNKDEIVFEKDCSGLYTEGGYKGLSLFFAEGTEDEVFGKYFDMQGIKPDFDSAPSAVFECRSRSRAGTDEKTILDRLEDIKGQPLGAEVFLIDKGYQTSFGDWLREDSSRFPLGLAPIAKQISGAGLIPGIWVAPFVCSEDSEIWQEHRNWIAKDQDGEWLKAGYDRGTLYSLDIMNKEVREHLRQVFSTIICEWGFRYLRLGYLYAACIAPRRNMTRGQLMTEAMAFLREITCGAVICACDVPLAPAFGRTDICLVSCASSASWDGRSIMGFSQRERSGARSSILSSVFRRQLNGRAFRSAAGGYLLSGAGLTMRQKQMLCEVNAAAGDVLSSPDDASSYSQDQLRLLSGMKAMKGASVISAGLYGNSLRVEYRIGERSLQRDYKI